MKAMASMYGATDGEHDRRDDRDRDHEPLEESSHDRDGTLADENIE